MSNEDFAFPTSLVEGGKIDTVTAFRVDSDTPVYQANEFHPMFDEIVKGLRVGDPNVWDLFDVERGIMSRFTQVTERVSWDGENVLWDGDPLHSVISKQLARALEDGNADDYTALAKFWEKLESNPNEHSRTQSYDWLAAHEFQITPEGDVVGYKYVAPVDGDKSFESVAHSQVSGTPSGYVNGVAVPPLSRIPQSIGDVVTMPRSEVEHDPRHACKRGLHVGTFDYVGGSHRNYVLEVHVNPRDIVSVPTDGFGGKVRVCRYVVARQATQEAPGTKAVLRESPDAIWAGDVGTKV